MIVLASILILRNFIHSEQYHWSNLFDNLYLPQASLLYNSSGDFTNFIDMVNHIKCPYWIIVQELSPVWVIWLSWLSWLSNLPKSYLELQFILSNIIGSYIYLRGCTPFRSSNWLIYLIKLSSRIKDGYFGVKVVQYRFY